MAGPTDNLARAQRRIELCRNNLYKRLDLSGLGLKSIPDSVRSLGHLHALDVNRNALTTLPSWLNDMRSLQLLDVRDNPALQLPAEIVADEDAPKILRYYVAATQGEPLNEFKLVLVGRGGVGKTTLAHRLASGQYGTFERTHGIQITQWSLDIAGKPIRSHVWDFGGQEIMHGTHRMFMTERAVYLVLLSGREGNEDRDADYWVSLVRSFAGDAPIIVLLHKWSDYPFEVNRQLLQSKYGPGLLFLQTDSATGHNLDALQARIAALASELPGLRAPWPSAWRQIKDDLAVQNRDWIRFDDFRAFCARRGVRDPRIQDTLADSLHDLGTLLSYRRDGEPDEFGVLNPQWATQGVYQILNAHEVREAAGQVSEARVAEILDERTYPRPLHRYLLGLMGKFRLCYPLPDLDGTHLIPDALSKEEPPIVAELVAGTGLEFVYQYPTVMPEGIVPRFIVDTYVQSQAHHAWRSGVVLERAGCRALVRGDLQRGRIEITVTGSGSGPRELLGRIRDHFERIHREFLRLDVDELVPIPGHRGATIPYGQLLAFERSGEKQYKVAVSSTQIVSLKIQRLLDGIDLPDMPRAVDRNKAPLPTPTVEPVRVFVCYARKNKRFLDELREELVAYTRPRTIDLWCDQRSEPGEDWDAEIKARLDAADIVVMLLTPGFIASNYCMTIELPRASERAGHGLCSLFPVLVAPCLWSQTPLKDISIVRPGGKSVDEHPRRDRGWIKVAEALHPIIERYHQRNRGRATLEASSDGG